MTRDSMSGQLRILSAGAGAGKTYSLSEAIVRAIESGVPADRIMATTFTIKAAEELTERVRRMLLEKGHRESAVRILDGYVGTMNSVFGRLLREFALELGLSPEQTVLAEEEAGVLFRSIASDVIDDYYRRHASVFRRLQMEGWEETVQKIIETARQNGMSPEAVRACADSSWTRLRLDVLPKPLEDAETLDTALQNALEFICSRGPAEGDETKGTQKEIEKLKALQAKWAREGELNWQEWAQISKVSPTKKSVEHFAPLIAAASVHDRHPRLHQDMRDAIFALFHCAADAMDKYQDEKAKRGMVDFTDQEALALGLLTNEDLAEALQERISQVFVDEFQDCSPLQLALITRLRQIANASTWVGDVKQAIFGFRGTDPVLMTAAMHHVDDEFIEILGDSRRSRKSLVEFVNDVFVPALKPIGLSEDKVRLNGMRLDKPGQSLALETWLYPECKKKEHDTQALATGIQGLLENPSKYLVEDKASHDLRPIHPSDVAILCRSNDECQDLANALGRLAIRATVGEAGLLSTPEAVLAVASFRYLADAKDTLALAEILHFASPAWSNGRWFRPWLEADQPREFFSGEARVAALDAVRERVADMSPTEVFDLALSASGIYETAMAWGDADQRLANLDAVRSLARQYEDSCDVNGIAATISGLSLFFHEVARSQGDLNRVADTHDENAVNILTYHKAKGLEWPVVILTSLHQGSERGGAPPVFDRTIAVTDPEVDFDFEHPLTGRRVFYWPWPYAQQSTHVGLDGHVDGLKELLEQKRRAREENARLMYVGMTRARDYLIFATRDANKALWLHELQDEFGSAVVNLPSGTALEKDELVGDEDPESTIRVGGAAYPCKLRILSLGQASQSEPRVVTPVDVGAEPFERSATSVQNASDPAYVAKIEPPVETAFVPAHFQPSKFAEELLRENVLTTDTIATVTQIGGRIPITGKVDMASLGDMVHAFLAADSVGRPLAERVALAEELKRRFGLAAVTATAIVETSDRLMKFMGDQYPNVIAVHREWPIHIRRGLQKASGWIDLALELSDGWILIDHKTFQGPTEKWVDKAKSYLPQLQIYAHALRAATQKPVLEAWIHMPIVGAMVGFQGEALVLPEVAGH
ncbi:UvrD-helicase domain-containing protein [Alicyclobacillus tolerans]|uniref:UvrD-helicase domain-containing protein n=1 Tax=Alicyclobacillus tolerans TaxID=90970 RepID=UPI001F00C966|nr:UvrD-helicase domain-containing protein [Alicyclobacillus tolerans]MCF8567975.1 UvrD-helicase domain-containing protein [Alicyclobacillus tolerans]